MIFRGAFLFNRSEITLTNKRTWFTIRINKINIAELRLVFLQHSEFLWSITTTIINLNYVIVYIHLIQNIKLQKENFGTEHHFYGSVLNVHFKKEYVYTIFRHVVQKEEAFSKIALKHLRFINYTFTLLRWNTQTDLLSAAYNILQKYPKIINTKACPLFTNCLE